MESRNVLVTGANGYVGNAVAKAFRRAGWTTYGLVRRADSVHDLELHEIRTIVGSVEDPEVSSHVPDLKFDVIVSNTITDGTDHFVKVRALIESLAQRSKSIGGRPLVMYSSGCKDYGDTPFRHGDPRLKPHTEETPLNPPGPLAPRSDFGMFLLGGDHLTYDATVLRPTIVYGGSSSHYGTLFSHAEESTSRMVLPAIPDAVMHSLHIDDCAEAYVALAEHPDRQAVAQQAFNIANSTYETAAEIGQALAQSYGLELEFRDRPSSPTASEDEFVHDTSTLTNFWQWVGSDKIRALTGWAERRQPFAVGIDEYRLAFEAHRRGRAVA